MFKKDCEPEVPRQCKEKKPKEPVILEGGKEYKKKSEECVLPLPSDYKEKDYFKLGSKDPTENERAKCLEDCHVKPLVLLLRECERRVTRKIYYTAENCHEETVNLMEALDKCVKAKAFNQLV